jgi:hypothetical protein
MTPCGQSLFGPETIMPPAQVGTIVKESIYGDDP